MKTSRAPSQKPASTARSAALDVLYQVTAEARLIAEVFDGAVEPLSPSDRARAGRLVTETLRWAGRADRMIGRHIRQRPPEDVLNALRLGAYEVHVAGEAPHGVVSSLVSLVRSRTKEPGLARLTNAVLRRITTAEDWSELGLPVLPKPLRKRLVASYGKGRVAAMEAVHTATPPIDLTAKTTPVDVARRTGGAALPTGSVRIASTGQVSALPGYSEGAWWVQDAAAALPARLLGVSPGARVLDLCAAPGGKTMQLAAAGAQVTAVDESASRMDVLHENLSRTGLTAQCVVADATKWTAPVFEAVLLDAPCSATGTIRRHPDLPFAKRDLDLAPLLQLQAVLFDKAVALLRPGGRMLFCTCSLFPEEGEDQIAAALGRHARLRLDPVQPDEVPGLEPDWITPNGALRITPESWADRGGIDGFFIARLILADG